MAKKEKQEEDVAALGAHDVLRQIVDLVTPSQGVADAVSQTAALARVSLDTSRTDHTRFRSHFTASAESALQVDLKCLVDALAQAREAAVDLRAKLALFSKTHATVPKSAVRV